MHCTPENREYTDRMRTKDALNIAAYSVASVSLVVGVLHYLTGRHFQTPWDAIGHATEGTATPETYATLIAEGGLVLAMALMLAGHFLPATRRS